MLDGDSGLTDVVVNNNLFKSGHYKLDELHSARDWIDLDGLFSYEKRRIIEKLISDEPIKQIIESKKTIIGINHYGAILAALAGYMYGKPFAYVFDSQKTVDTLEREINSIEKDGILFLIDVVVFGDSLCKVLDAMHEKGIIDESNGVDVIILFERMYKKSGRYNRRYDLSKIYSSKFIHKVYVINDEFDIELCNKNSKDCIFRKGNKDDNCDNERNV